MGRYLLGIILLAFPASGMEVVSYGLGNSTSFNLGGSTAESQLGLGAGVGIGFQLGSSRGRRSSGGRFLEVGAQYLSRSYGNNAGGTTSLKYFSVPLLFRYHLGMLAMGAGFQVGFPQGEVDTGTSSMTFSEAGFASLDAGIVFAVGARIPLNRLLLMVEARYNYGMLNASSDPRVVARFTDVQLMAGVGVHF